MTPTASPRAARAGGDSQVSPAACASPGRGQPARSASSVADRDEPCAISSTPGRVHLQGGCAHVVGQRARHHRRARSAWPPPEAARTPPRRARRRAAGPGVQRRQRGHRRTGPGNTTPSRRLELRTPSGGPTTTSGHGSGKACAGRAVGLEQPGEVLAGLEGPHRQQELAGAPRGASRAPWRRPRRGTGRMVGAERDHRHGRPAGAPAATRSAATASDGTTKWTAWRRARSSAASCHRRPRRG